MLLVSIVKDASAESDSIIDTAETEDNIAWLEGSLAQAFLEMVPAYIGRYARV
jgi:hypothetical protein